MNPKVLEHVRKQRQNWLPRAIRHAHWLEHRINKLRGKFYPGCGFHWSSVRSIRGIRQILYEISEDENTPWWRYSIVRVSLEHLTKDVKKAEDYVPEENLVRVIKKG